MAENQGLSQWQNEYLKNFKLSDGKKHAWKQIYVNHEKAEF